MSQHHLGRKLIASFHWKPLGRRSPSTAFSNNSVTAYILAFLMLRELLATVGWFLAGVLIGAVAQDSIFTLSWMCQ